MLAIICTLKMLPITQRISHTSMKQTLYALVNATMVQQLMIELSYFTGSNNPIVVKGKLEID